MLAWLPKLARGFEGHPVHPPLTDATIGAFTLGVVAAVLGWIGIAEEGMASVAFFAVVVGLLVSVPTIVTGFVDYLDVSRGTPLWRTATAHWVAMVAGVGTFLVAAPLLHDGWRAGEISSAGAIVALAAEAVLTLGGWLGGTIVYVYGMRVVELPGKPSLEAVAPADADRTSEIHD